jgi:heterogeneous nuclear rnp K-like protein 2
LCSDRIDKLDKMSASPPPATHSAKRPLEEASSPSRAGDQPDAKRPALDKVIKNDEETEALDAKDDSATESGEKNDTESTNGVATEQSEAAAPDASADDKPVATSAVPSTPSADAAATTDETAWIHIRAVISSPEAATVIGKGGENVSNIRKMSNAKCTVSDYQKGAVERILTVSGVVDAVAKVRNC